MVEEVSLWFSVCGGVCAVVLPWGVRLGREESNGDVFCEWGFRLGSEIGELKMVGWKETSECLLLGMPRLYFSSPCRWFDAADVLLVFASCARFACTPYLSQ